MRSKDEGLTMVRVHTVYVLRVCRKGSQNNSGKLYCKMYNYEEKTIKESSSETTQEAKNMVYPKETKKQGTSRYTSMYL